MRHNEADSPILTDKYWRNSEHGPMSVDDMAEELGAEEGVLGAEAEVLEANEIEYREQLDETLQAEDDGEVPQRYEPEVPPDQVQAAWQQTAQQAQVLQQQAAQVTAYEQSVDWQTLRETDPAEFAARQQELINTKVQLDQAWQQTQQQAQQIQQVNEQQQIETGKAKIEHERQRLSEILPGWGPTMALQLRGYLRDQGFTDSEVDNIGDHRVVLQAVRAMQADRTPSGRRRVKIGGSVLSSPSEAQHRHEQARDVEAILTRDNIQPHSVEAAAVRIERLLSEESKAPAHWAGNRARSRGKLRSRGNSDVDAFAERLLDEGYI